MAGITIGYFSLGQAAQLRVPRTVALTAVLETLSSGLCVRQAYCLTLARQLLFLRVLSMKNSSPNQLVNQY